MKQATALVTGASAGIGEALTRQLAKAGHPLILVARRQECLDQLAAELKKTSKVSVVAYAIDLSQPAGPAALLKRLAADKHTVDIVVNNAGMGVYGPFWQTEWPSEQRLLQLNILTPTVLIKQLLPGMRQRGRGRILNIASLAAFQPGPMMPLYYASKAYLVSLSESLAASLEGSGVTVTVSCPGPVATEFAANTGSTDNPHDWRNISTISAEQVARASLQAMNRGQLLVIPSNRHQVLHWAGKLLPRGLRGSMLRRGQRWMRGDEQP